LKATLSLDDHAQVYEGASGELMPTAHRCMIVNDHAMVRLGIRRLIEADYEVEALSDGGDAIEALRSVGSFDVAIVEMRCADDVRPSGAGTIRGLLREQPSLGIVAHGGRIERHAMREGLDAGAACYVSRHSAPDRLIEAISAAAQQERYLDPRIVADSGAQSAITRRQREVLQLFANGLSTDDVARRLGVSAETIRTHAKASLARLGARDRGHAIAIAIRGSLIE